METLSLELLYNTSLPIGERELVKSIVYVWKDLRDVRKNQNYSVTSHKLIIHKENSDPHKDAQVRNKNKK